VAFPHSHRQSASQPQYLDTSAGCSEPPSESTKQMHHARGSSTPSSSEPLSTREPPRASVALMMRSRRPCSHAQECARGDPGDALASQKFSAGKRQCTRSHKC
jgi:hypothetical protein